MPFYPGQGSSGSRVFPGNTGREEQKHSEWDASWPQHTVHTRSLTHSHQVSEHLLACFWEVGGNRSNSNPCAHEENIHRNSIKGKAQDRTGDRNCEVAMQPYCLPMVLMWLLCNIIGIIIDTVQCSDLRYSS